MQIREFGKYFAGDKMEMANRAQELESPNQIYKRDDLNLLQQ